MSVEHDEDVTGSREPPVVLSHVRFGRYEITVRLGPANEFRGIEEVAVAKDFLSPEQKVRSSAHHDVSDLYEELGEDT